MISLLFAKYLQGKQPRVQAFIGKLLFNKIDKIIFFDIANCISDSSKEETNLHAKFHSKLTKLFKPMNF